MFRAGGFCVGFFVRFFVGRFVELFGGGLFDVWVADFFPGGFDGFDFAFFFDEGAVHGGEASAGVGIERGVMKIGGGDAGDGAGLGLEAKD